MKHVAASKDYTLFLAEIKQQIASARIKASRSVNREMITLYWNIGKMIAEKQENLGWGKAVVETLSKDLREAFPGIKGFSQRNLWNMKNFYEQYQFDTKLQQLVAEIPWGQNLLIMQKVKDPDARRFYLEQTAERGWSRNLLLNQIKAQTYERSKLKPKQHNFSATLSEAMAEQADESMKSEYCLEFLGIDQVVKERDLENRLIEKLKEFILELGYGFCFIGRQFRLTLGVKEYFVDLLFYHRFLKSLVAIELKAGPFKPEYAGKMDFYLNVLNENEKAPDDNPSIGIILCAEKDNLEVEFALRSKQNPIGVAEYHLHRELPEGYRGKLPSADELAEKFKEKMGILH